MSLIIDADSNTTSVLKAMLALMLFLVVSLLNYFVGTFIPATEDRIAQGFVGWNRKSSMPIQSPADMT